MKDLLKRLLVEEEGQGITEYALILGLVVFGIWFAISQTTIGSSLAQLFVDIVGTIEKCGEGTCGGTGTTGGN